MNLFNQAAKKLGLKKPRYSPMQVRHAAYISFKALAARAKKNHVDLFNELLVVSRMWWKKESAYPTL